MKWKAQFSNTPSGRFRNRYTTPSPIFAATVLMILTVIYAFAGLVDPRYRELETLFWVLGLGIPLCLAFFYFNRLYPHVYLEDGVLYRRGYLRGFHLELHEDDVKNVVYKRTLRGKSILIVGRAHRGEPSTWSKNVIVLCDCPANREFLTHFWEKEKRELFL